ncbi:Ribonuclease H protein [Melia azedarach]|uniref:Ribonuclease H protein n=1 Tax=Melia azedarach TaxID=155640 RepID=A0ACC1WTT8_MELAZ|nr:Ribonuclease H protein [Melia azedarach]
MGNCCSGGSNSPPRQTPQPGGAPPRLPVVGPVHTPGPAAVFRPPSPDHQPNPEMTPPPPLCINANSDGLAKGNPGDSACGGVFCDHLGNFLGGFSLCIGLNTVFFAELLAVILVVELAFERGWNNLWLESDSMIVIQHLYNPSLLPPWRLRNRWLNCLHRIHFIDFRCSHTYRENNNVADRLANLGLVFPSLHWWNSPPPCVAGLLSKDTCGFPNYRFT